MAEKGFFPMRWDLGHDRVADIYCPPEETLIITAEQYLWAVKIMAHAEAHYEDGGWDVLVECYEPEQVCRLIWGWGNEPAVTYDEAMAVVMQCVSIWDDRQADARNSAF